MAIGTITVSGTVTGLPSGSKTIGPNTVNAPTAVGETHAIPLASGNNVISVPGGSTAVMITTPVGNVADITFKGAVAGDTGIRIAKVGSNLVSFDSAAVPATINILASAIVSTPVEFLFI